MGYANSQMFIDNRFPKKRLLRLPVAAIRVGDPSSGASRVFLMEALPSRNCSVYQKIIDFYVNGLERTAKQSTPPMTKENLEDILTLAQSDRKRLLVNYAVFKTSGLLYPPIGGY